MALSSLLDIVNRAQDELGLSRSAAVVAASDVTSRQMLALLNTGGRELMRHHDWGDLMTLTTVTTVSGTSDYPLQPDYHRMIEQTHWDRSNLLRLGGPITPQRDRYIRERNISNSSVFHDFRQIGSTSVRITPTPSSVAILVYEYISKYWALSAADVAQPEFAADSDTSVFDSDLHVKDLKWRFMAAKGLEAVALKAEFDEVLKLAVSADRGGAVLRLTKRRLTTGDMVAGTGPNVILTETGDQLVVE